MARLRYVPRFICLLICGFKLQHGSGMNSDQGYKGMSKVATIFSTMHCYSTRKTHNISRFKKNNSTSIVQIQIIHAYFLLLRPLNWGSVDSGMKIILVESDSVHPFAQCTEVRFASFLSSWFITALVVIPPERKLAKRTSVQWCGQVK